MSRCDNAYALKELHIYDIDYPGLLATREALLGFGRGLVAEGVIDAIDDVWMLERGELRTALVETLDVRELVSRRRGELDRGRAEGPRPFLGEDVPERQRDAALEKFYGSRGSALVGAAASRGVAEGIARVVRGPDVLLACARGRGPRRHGDDAGVDTPLLVSRGARHGNGRNPEPCRGRRSRIPAYPPSSEPLAQRRPSLTERASASTAWPAR